jgi:hypothetical protein
MKEVKFDLQEAHRHFSAACFNATWDLIDKDNRTKEDDDQMIRLCMASTWHWTQRKDVTDTNLSIGYWQAARVYAILDQAKNALYFAQTCLEISQREGVPAFYLGYAYEALARAEAVAGDEKAKADYLTQAIQIAEKLTDAEEKKMLGDDLEELSGV